MERIAIIVWIGRSSGSLSMLASLLIIYMILSRPKRKLTRPKNRLMLMMSVFDVLHSSTFIIGTMAVPRETGIYGAIGSPRTCTAQGFIALLGLAVPLYNNALNLFYLLIIKYEVNSKQFSRKIEPFCHAFSILVPLSIGIVFAKLGWIQVEQPMGTICYVNDNAVIFLGLAMVLMFLFLIYTMVSICYIMNIQSNSMDQYRFGPKDMDRRSILDIKETIVQALLYTFAFIITFIFPAIEIFLALIGIPEAPFAIKILTTIFLPMQGFWNCAFYIRPGVSCLRRRNPGMPFIGAVWKVISNSGSIANKTKHRSPRNKRQVILNCDIEKSNSLAGSVRVDLQEMTNCNGNSVYDFDGIACKVDCPALAYDEEAWRANLLVDDVLPKMSPDSAEYSSVQTANVHGNPQDTTQTFATREGSLYALIESKQSALESYPDSDDQCYTRESKCSIVANDKLTRIEGIGADKKLECACCAEPTGKRRRISFVCLASILSEGSFDSLEDDT